MKGKPSPISPWTATSQSLADTEELARMVASLLTPPSVLLLSGDLGAGKTSLVQCFLKYWGYEGTVKSPTFDLVHVYDLSALTVYHVDLYRLHQGDPLDVLDLPAPGDPAAVVLAEWGGALQALYPNGFEMRMDQCGEQCRTMALTPYGDHAVQRFLQWRAMQEGQGLHS